MNNTDPIADMLTRIRNAIAVNKTEVSLPHSKIKETVAKLLVENKYLDGVKVEKAEVGQTLHLTINGIAENARINSLSRLSTPGRRMYVKAKEIPRVKQGRGIVIVSTSHGIMTGEVARKKQLGGELLCEVY
jgi:small subunit ribosomal protein S8